MKYLIELFTKSAPLPFIPFAPQRYGIFNTHTYRSHIVDYPYMYPSQLEPIIRGLNNGAIKGKLDLKRRGVANCQLEKIIAVLLGNTTVTSLDLSGNEISDAAAVSLARLIQTNVYITEIDLVGNRISAVGITVLQQALENNFIITYFNIEEQARGINALVDRNIQFQREKAKKESYKVLATKLKASQFPEELTLLTMSYYSEANSSPAQLHIERELLSKILSWSYHDRTLQKEADESSQVAHNQTKFSKTGQTRKTGL